MKQNFNQFPLAIVALAAVVFGFSACVHQPPVEGCPLDNVDSSPVAICDPDVVYFEKDVLPILRSNCAKSGCHDAITAEEDIIMTDFANISQSLELNPCNPSKSELIEVLYETGEERMPPAGHDPLTAQQIQILEDWIAQGAQNFLCNDGCDTTNVTFSGSVSPLVTQHCVGCHSGANPSGGIMLTNYTEIAPRALNGEIMGALTGVGFTAMPPTGPLPDCQIATIQIWIDAGAPNN